MGQLVVPAGDGPVAFEPANAAFDGVALVRLQVEGGPTAGVALASRGGRHGRRPFAFNQGIVSRLQYGVMPLLERVRTDQVIVGLVYQEPGELAASVECW